MAAAAALVAAYLMRSGSARRQAAVPPARTSPERIEPVASLGRLDPAGDIRRLAAPITGIGGSPRIAELLVSEGQRVKAGQLLALFDTTPTHRAERQLLLTRIANLTRRLTLEGRDLARYRQLGKAGAVSAVELDTREQEYLVLQGELEEARAELAKLDTDQVNTELRAPIDGTILRIQARVGERPGDKGILDLGNSDRMEALVEVYESDIDRVRLGQTVILTSENGGFNGNLRGTVSRISPQVRQREILSTDPTGDADARIVEVRVRLEPSDASRVRDLTGMKVIARLQP